MGNGMPGIEDIDGLKEGLARLYARRRFGIKLGCESVEHLLEAMGHPEEAYGIIHIAGSNGKGSVAAILASILRAAGLSVGLYTSPHLVRFNERIRVNGVPITDEELVVLLRDVEERLDADSKEEGQDELTFFETTTVMAFEAFRRAGVSVVVLETGLGGRLDATNVVTPLVSVITRIGLEHMKYLGDDILQIAGEKCGIIKEGRPVVCGAQEEDVKRFVSAHAVGKHCAIIHADDAVGIQRRAISYDGQKVHVESQDNSYGAIRFPLVGAHQLENLATAVATAEMFFNMVGVDQTRDAVREGIAAVRWSGRFEVLKTDPPLIADAAHNPNGAAALVATLKGVHAKRVGLVLGVCADKDIGAFLKAILGSVSRVWAVPLTNERGMDPTELAQMAKAMGMRADVTSLKQALDDAEAWARSESGVVVVTGSLFLLGDVYELLGIEPYGGHLDE